MDIRETDAVRIRFHRWPDFFPARRRGALQVHSLSTLLRSPHEVSLFAHCSRHGGHSGII
jgi:hypothetical protein